MTTRDAAGSAARAVSCPMTTTIVAALAEELAPLVRRARITERFDVDGCRLRSGWLGQHAVVLARTGVGARRARRGLAVALDRFPSGFVIGIGVAGGLSPGLAPGTLVVARGVGRGAAPTAPDAAWVERALATGQVLPATFVAADRILATAAAKAAALRAARTVEPVAVVDLESAAFAEQAARRGIPYGLLRTVCDPAEEDLPLDFEGFRDDAGALRRARLAGHALLRPGLAGKLWQLRRRVAAGSERLAQVLEHLL